MGRSESIYEIDRCLQGCAKNTHNNIEQRQTTHRDIKQTHLLLPEQEIPGDLKLINALSFRAGIARNQHTLHNLKVVPLQRSECTFPPGKDIRVQKCST